MWYYEEWTVLGRWSPRTEPGQPSGVTASGTKRKIRAVREVPENMTGYDLNVLRDWSDAVIGKDAFEAAADRAVEVVPEPDDKGWAEALVPPLPRLRAAPLAWREIDPGRRAVGTGLGFTCEIHWLHGGGWDGVSHLRTAFAPTEDGIKAAMQATYEAMLLSYVEVLP